MMGKVDINNIAKETICILDYFDPKFTAKIPLKVINNLKALSKESNETIIVDKNKKLKEQQISEGTKDLLSLIYYTYIATEEQKIELTKNWNKNELLYQEEIKDKYNVDNLFKREHSKEKNELIVVEDKENLLKRILNKLKEKFSREN